MLENLSLPVRAAVGGVANAINLDNEAALNMDELYKGQRMQVGPHAQVLIGYAQGHKLTLKWAGEAMLADLAEKHWDLPVKTIASGDARIYVKPQFGDKELCGVGLHEASRGSLSHWVVIKNGEIANYQAVVPTTWNAGPRDENGAHGPCEASLLGNPIADPERPLEVLRTVHLFDPCLACAIHAFDPDGKEVISGS